jgi:hypothetical protein
MDTNRYNITDYKLICRLLPFFVRGRFTVLLLESLFYPLSLVHAKFLVWALERMVEASITSQPKSLIWYLNHCFRAYFSDSSASFDIADPTCRNFSSAMIYHSYEYNFLATSILRCYRLADTPKEPYESITIYNTYEDVKSNISALTLFAPATKYGGDSISREILHDYKVKIMSKADNYVLMGVDYEIHITK